MDWKCGSIPAAYACEVRAGDRAGDIADAVMYDAFFNVNRIVVGRLMECFDAAVIVAHVDDDPAPLCIEATMERSIINSVAFFGHLTQLMTRSASAISFARL